MKHVKLQIQLEYTSALILILVVAEELYTFLFKKSPNYGLPIFD
jgi:hypothetical protein